MLDKLAMIAQGGVSKATRTLNLSEDLFAGMDAQLRGREVAYREYFKVGKGRDMGFGSILGFFCKLSSGTAQMSTSRQSYRLGVRLSFGRLLGFYYGHAGYYLSQLHLYHVLYGVFVIQLLFALADGVGLLPLVSVAAISIMELLFSLSFGIFFVANLLPVHPTKGVDSVYPLNPTPQLEPILDSVCEQLVECACACVPDPGY
eukprot:187141-Prymnesium_polylepis.1